MIITRELRDPAPAERTRDPDVARLQRELKALGHHTDILDGRFGPNTTAAVQAFARSRNQQQPPPQPGPLREDGVVDARLAAYLNSRFHETAVGILVKDREDALALKEQRIQQIQAELSRTPGPGPDRELELRRRLHRWLDRKAEELVNDPFHGIRGYELAALLPEDRYATGLLAEVLPEPQQGRPLA